MKRCAVVIGIDETGGLPKLSAAASGAKDFDEWARSQGIKTALLTDDHAPVKLDDVKKAVKALLDVNIYEQLIIFFAGHGMLKSADAEVWLLSGAPVDPDEAVNLPLSVSHARNSPLQHVVFISDACRSLPTSVQQFGVIGRSIFPNLRPPRRRPRIDLMFASAPGDPAYEAPIDEALDTYRGIYSGVLLTGLSDPSAGVAETHEGKSYVFTRGIDPFLSREVPKAAGKINLTLRQLPETRPESGPPLYLAELQSTVRGTPPAPPLTRSTDSSNKSLRRVMEQALTQMAGAEPPDDPMEARVLGDMNRVLSARGRAAFESFQGFTIIGAKVRAAYSFGQAGVDVFEEEGHHHVRLFANKPSSTLVIFDDGSSTILAAWPELIGTLLVKDGGIANVSYTPSRGTSRFDEYESVAEDVEKRRALVASRALNGSFNLDPENAARDARYLRQLKAIDPTLGIYAAYAYAQAGATEQIQSLFHYMRRDLAEPPFDVALLASELPDGSFAAGSIVPLCPMLTQGWLLLDEAWGQLPTEVAAAGRHLRTALWTTFRPEATDRLEQLFSSGGNP